MKLANKMLIMIIIYFLVGILSLKLLTENVILKSCSELEQENIKLEAQRVKNGFDSTIGKLQGITLDWAYWDATYNYLKYRNDYYINHNIVPTMFEDIGLDYLILLDEKGEVVLNYKYDRDKKEILKASSDIVYEIESFKLSEKAKGLVWVDDNAVAITSCQVRNANKTKESIGLLILGFNFNDTIIEKIRTNLKSNIEIDYIVPSEIFSEIKIMDYEDYSVASFKVDYLNTDKSMKVSINAKKNITKLGKYTSNEFLWFVTVSFIVFTLLLYLSLKLVIIRRLYKLRQDTNEITRSKDLSKRLSIKGNDEVTLLKDDINYMLEKIRLMNKEIREYATIDVLTGALNRRVGVDILEKLINLVKNEEIQLTIAYVDVNGLKEVNDKLGHKIGDQLLVEVTKIIQSNIRESDKICRLGGDEFLVIFPYTQEQAVINIFDRIQKSLNNINKSGEKKYQVDIAVGVIEHDRYMNVNKFIDLADKKMYIDKKNKKSKDSH